MFFVTKDYLQTCNSKISCWDLTDFIVVIQRISYHISSFPQKWLRRGKQVISTKASRQGKWRGLWMKKGVDIFWLLKCCLAARANRQKGEVDEGSFSAGAPCLPQLLPEIRSGSREIARLACLFWALWCFTLLCGAWPSWARAQLPAWSNPTSSWTPQRLEEKNYSNFSHRYSGDRIFCKEPCLTWTIWASLETPAEGQSCRMVPWRALPPGTSDSSHSTHSKADRPALMLQPIGMPCCPQRDPHPLLSQVVFFCQEHFSLCERSKAPRINISIFPLNISSLICMVFLLWKGAICKKWKSPACQLIGANDVYTDIPHWWNSPNIPFSGLGG